MKEYDRLTNQKWSEDIDLKQEFGYSHIYKRLYELEDKIESGELVSKEWHDEQVLHAESEIERLQAKLTEYEKPICKLIKDREKQAIKAFAESVKQAFYYEFDELIPSIMADKIDDLVKEFEK